MEDIEITVYLNGRTHKDLLAEALLLIQNDL